MIRIFTHFICRIKEDTYKMATDQLIYWGGFLYIHVNAISFHTDFVYNWLFLNGWLVLLVGRVVLLGIDLYKRARDINKPEWKSNVTPILKLEAVENRKKSFFQILVSQIKLFLKW